MTDDVASNRAGRVSEERVGLGRDLVGNGDHCVVQVAKPEKVVHMLVEVLLSLGQCPSPNIFRTEMGRQRVNDQDPYVEVMGKVLRLLHEQHLVMGVERSCHMDLLQRFLWVHFQGDCHLDDPLRAEGVLGVDDEHVTIQAPVLHGATSVHRQLEAHLGLPTSELTEELGDGLRLQTSSHQLIEGLRTGGQLVNVPPSLLYQVSGLKPSDVRGLLGSCDDLHRCAFPYLCYLR